MFPALFSEVRFLPKAFPAISLATSSAILPMLFRISFFILLSPFGEERLRPSLLPLKTVSRLLCLSFLCRQVVKSLAEVVELTLQRKGVAPPCHTTPAHVVAIASTSPGSSSKAASLCLRRIVGSRGVGTITISPSGLRTITHRSGSISSRHNVHLLSQNHEFVLVLMK